MSAPPSSPWGRWSTHGRTGPTPNPLLRISDADRNEAAERLSKNYSDGRLDQAEFNERLEQAMKAKTHADLAGLFDDLPPVEAPPSQQPPRQRQRSLARPIGLVIFVVIAIVIARGLTRLFFFPFPFPFIPVPWLVIVVLAFLFLRRRRWHGRP